MKTRRIELICVALPALAWIFYLLAGGWVAGTVAAHWGAKILAAADGNVTDAALFVHNREHDAVVLLSLACGLALVQLLLAKLVLRPASSMTRRWVFQAVAGFVGVNLWLAEACHTTLFWGLMWEGRAETTALARFELKHHLLLESPAPRKAAILGNSQARAQLDEGLLNEQLGPLLFTCEMHFPGARAYDLWLVHRHLEPATAQVIICYVSEMTFYNNVVSEATPYMSGFADWSDRRSLGIAAHFSLYATGYGLLGDVLPAFYLRDALAQRVLGLGVSDIRQRQHDEMMKASQAEVVDDGRDNFRLSYLSDFQKRAFEAFATDCARNGQKLVIIAGQLNPKLGAHIDPEVRQDMLAFLRGLRQSFPSVVLIDDCPAQTESEYDDLTHVNRETQDRFTRFIAERMRIMLTEAADAQ